MIPLRQRTLNRICWKMQESSGAWDAFSTVPGSSAPFSKFERQMSIHPYFFHAQLRAWANRLACFSAALWHQEFNTRSLDPIVYFFTVGWDLDTKEIAQLHRISNFHNLPRSSWITDAIWCHIPSRLCARWQALVHRNALQNGSQQLRHQLCCAAARRQPEKRTHEGLRQNRHVKWFHQVRLVSKHL